jgi:hypothetical protein
MDIRIGLACDENTCGRCTQQHFAPGLFRHGDRRESRLVRQLGSQQAHDACLVASGQHSHGSPVAPQACDGVHPLEQCRQRQFHQARRLAEFGLSDGSARRLVDECLYACKSDRQ